MSIPSVTYETLRRYKDLFTGFDEAYGTGRGAWVKSKPTLSIYADHLAGVGEGLGIGPLMRDGTVKFAAIDLDAPDFDLAREFQRFIPGTSFIERSRSGNAHVWVFFSEPCVAWVAVGILQQAIIAAGAKHVEVFPKQTSMERVTLGNYINLPYFGGSRPMLSWFEGREESCTLEGFLDWVEKEGLNDPESWRRRADWLMIEDPALRRKSGPGAEFGTQRNLHMCAEYVIEGVLSGERPIMQGSKSVVYFNLAKQLANCEMWTQEETWEVMEQLIEASPDKPNVSEVARFVRNAYEKQYTSTGCDDPVFQAYAHPDCPIAHPRRS